MTQYRTGDVLSSATVQQHADFLGTVRADFAAFLEAFTGVTRDLSSVPGSLQAAASNDVTIDRLHTDLTTSWAQRRAVIAVEAQKCIDRLEATSGFGGRAAQDLRILEGRLVTAEEDVINRRNEYQRVAALDGVPILDGVERAVRDPVDDAYRAFQSAVSARDGVIDDLKMISAMWVHRLEQEFDDMPETLRPDEEGYEDWGATPAVSDASIDPSGQRRSLWTAPGSFVSSQGTVVRSMGGAQQVVQGKLGDCYFASAVASIASTSAGMEFLRRMIVDNGDGTYTVTFPGRAPITVDGRVFVDANGRPLAGDIVDGTFWFAILEKAYAELKGGYDDLGHGGQEAMVLRDFGLGGARDELKNLSDDRLRQILASVELGVPVTVGGSIQRLFPDFPHAGGHALSVVGYDAGPPAVVYIRNPWGDNGSWTTPAGTATDLGGGVLQVPLSKVRDLFDEVSYASSSVA